MPTSATGISSSSRARGFTLIEILVVVVIIGVMVTGALLSLSTVGEDRGLRNENDRLFALMNYAREQAELQTREYGLRFYEGGYEFVSFDSRAGPQGGKWARIQGDEALRSRSLPPDLNLTIRIEGRSIVLPKKKDPKSKQIEDLTPQVMLFSSGELNSFEIGLLRPASGKGLQIASSESEAEIETSEIPAGAT